MLFGSIGFKSVWKLTGWRVIHVCVGSPYCLTARRTTVQSQGWVRPFCEEFAYPPHLCVAFLTYNTYITCTVGLWLEYGVWSMEDRRWLISAGLTLLCVSSFPPTKISIFPKWRCPLNIMNPNIALTLLLYQSHSQVQPDTEFQCGVYMFLCPVISSQPSHAIQKRAWCVGELVMNLNAFEGLPCYYPAVFWAVHGLLPTTCWDRLQPCDPLKDKQ